MALVLDTEAIDPSGRPDAVLEAVQRLTARSYMAHQASREAVHARLDAFEFGQVTFVRGRVSGFRLVRTAKQIRSAPNPLLAVCVQRSSGFLLTQAEIHRRMTPGQLYAVDFDLPYEIDWPDNGVASAMYIPAERLGLSAETIRAGAARPHSSPLHPLVTGHLRLLSQCADELQSDTAARELGDSCVELVRALLVSAAGQVRADGTVVPEDILLTQIRDYIGRRLNDPELGAARIARAHHISVRHLYKVCAAANFGLEQWIIEQRLELARGALARPDNAHRSIAALAHSCGFRDPSHFARRFRAAYGISPSEWRRLAREQAGATGRSAADEPLDVVLPFPAQ
ncbi:helix-turn-helix domain-containing protein [Nocardia transvalensis]|uniref:helix-turn-helix domain-containing protein n=1 Tax=Nocardia transvalensis TaxID=37333 RepID=UPI001894A1F6|nr:helix-turn-helix domain-containing protein [Nocardia transvalensis]MBF6329167.1 helix-turn-helix domain-containing protein [Nocardia transvalensis]